MVLPLLQRSLWLVSFTSARREQNAFGDARSDRGEALLFEEGDDFLQFFLASSMPATSSNLIPVLLPFGSGAGFTSSSLT